MKKSLFYLLIPLLFIACKLPDYSEKILGTYSQTSISQNELSNDSEGEVFALCNTKKVVNLVFNEDNSYLFSINQFIEDITFNGETQISLEPIINYFVHNIEIHGTYSLKGNKLTFTNNTVLLNDGTEIDFDTYKEIDPAIGNKEQIVKFEVDEEKINLIYGKESISYKRK